MAFLIEHGITNGLSPLFNTLRLYAGTPLLSQWHGPASPVENPAAYFTSPAVAKFFAEVTSPEKYKEIVNLVRRVRFETPTVVT